MSWMTKTSQEFQWAAGGGPDRGGRLILNDESDIDFSTTFAEHGAVYDANFHLLVAQEGGSRTIISII